MLKQDSKFFEFMPPFYSTLSTYKKNLRNSFKLLAIMEKWKNEGQPYYRNNNIFEPQNQE